MRSLIVILLAAVASAVACSSAGEAPPGIEWTGDGDIATAGPCSDGASRTCHETLDQANGKLTCYHGKQVCADGVWGPCTDGETTVELDPRSAEYSGFFQRHGLAYSTATACTNNACDPSCMNFLETPPVMSGGSMSGGGIPTVAWSPLLNEPCSTGADCQVNYRCNHPDSGTCAHSKCYPGTALNAGCDDCVARVCSVDATCCSGSWTEDCVDMVASVCDAVCDGYGCVHEPCGVTGAPLESTCHSCIATTCATSGYEDCCTDFWSFACELKFREACGVSPVVTEPTDGGSMCDYSAYGRYEMQTYQTNMLGGWVGSPSSASQNITNSYILGNATSSGSLFAYGTTIDGDLQSGSGSVFGPPYTVVTGSITNVVPPAVTLPTKTVSCTTGSDPRSGTLAPGSYGDVTVAAGATLTLQEGTYTFNSLTMGANSILELPDDGSIVTINTCGNVIFNSNADMTGLTQGTAMNVSFYVANGYFSATGSNNLYGMIIAQGNGSGTNPCNSGDPCNLSALEPGGIYVGQNSYIYGITAANRRLDVRGGTTIDATGLEDMCELLWENPGSVTVTYPACPSVPPSLPDESATCEENTTGYTDASCAGHDLALGLPQCDGTIDVCNHGTVAFSGTVNLGYFDAADMQLATDSPSAPDGTCSDSLTIAPGTCETMTCGSLPMDTDQTIMVDPSGTTGECDDRRLDNWSYFEAASCVSIDDVQIYEAVCSEAGTSPRWGLLLWDTTLAGDGTVTFSATTAPSVADLGAAPAPVELGVATATQQLCSRTPDGYCPRDITDILGLGTNQSQHEVLELTIEGGGSSPTLNDFTITYSCVQDQ